MTERTLESLKKGTLLLAYGGRWVLGERLGSGAFGAVFECAKAGSSGGTTPSSFPFAIKVSPTAAAKGSAKAKKTGLSVASGLMNKEYLVYTQQLRYHPGLPVVPRDAYGQDDHFAWLVMQKMNGGTLQHKMDAQPNGALSWKTTATIAMQLISILAHVHAKGHVFLDIKADNVMFSGPQPLEGLNAANTAFKDGKGQKSSAEIASSEEGIRHPTDERVYLVDFGVCDRYKGFDGSAKPATGNGSPIFTSLASVRGWTTGPGEDLESLGYLLIYMLRGSKGGNLSLPWSKAASLDEVNKIKLATSTSSHLSSSVPAEAQKPVKAFLDKVLNVQPTNPINYQQLMDILRPHASHDGKLDFSSSAMSLKSPGKRKFGASSPPPPTSTAISPKHIQSPSNSSSGRKRSAPSVSPSDMVERQPPQPRKITKKAVEAVAIANVVEEEEEKEKVKVQPPTERKRKVFSAKKGAAVATISSVSPSSEKVYSDILAQAMKQASEDRKKRAERRRSATDLVGTVSKAIGSLLIW
jgi:serine/threonine protein kinase